MRVYQHCKKASISTIFASIFLQQATQLIWKTTADNVSWIVHESCANTQNHHKPTTEAFLACLYWFLIACVYKKKLPSFRATTTSLVGQILIFRPSGHIRKVSCLSLSANVSMPDSVHNYESCDRTKVRINLKIIVLLLTLAHTVYNNLKDNCKVARGPSGLMVRASD